MPACKGDDLFRFLNETAAPGRKGLVNPLGVDELAIYHASVGAHAVFTGASDTGIIPKKAAGDSNHIGIVAVDEIGEGNGIAQLLAVVAGKNVAEVGGAVNVVLQCAIDVLGILCAGVMRRCHE